MSRETTRSSGPLPGPSPARKRSEAFLRPVGGGFGQGRLLVSTARNFTFSGRSNLDAKPAARHPTFPRKFAQTEEKYPWSNYSRTRGNASACFSGPFSARAASAKATSGRGLCEKAHLRGEIRTPARQGMVLGNEKRVRGMQGKHAPHPASGLPGAGLADLHPLLRRQSLYQDRGKPPFFPRGRRRSPFPECLLGFGTAIAQTQSRSNGSGSPTWHSPSSPEK